VNKKIVLWDLDGTLIQINRFGIDKHAKSVELATGLPIRGNPNSRGKTDRQLITEHLDLYPTPLKMECINRSLEILDTLTTRELASTSLLSTKSALLAIRAVRDIGWENSILTGNTPHRAKIKSISAGLWDEFSESDGFFGHLHTSRIELVQFAIETIRQTAQTHIVIIGDTPLDIESAHKCGVPVVAISTGDFSYQELQMHSPNLLIQDLDIGLMDLLDFLDTCSFIS
jgi:phosphoglycolate phosphatase